MSRRKIPLMEQKPVTAGDLVSINQHGELEVSNRVGAVGVVVSTDPERLQAHIAMTMGGGMQVNFPVAPRDRIPEPPLWSEANERLLELAGLVEMGTAAIVRRTEKHSSGPTAQMTFTIEYYKDELLDLENHEDYLGRVEARALELMEAYAKGMEKLRDK